VFHPVLKANLVEEVLAVFHLDHNRAAFLLEPRHLVASEMLATNFMVASHLYDLWQALIPEGLDLLVESEGI